MTEFSLDERAKLEKRIAGALQQCINDHGPITAEWKGSASKRIITITLES